MNKPTRSMIWFNREKERNILKPKILHKAINIHRSEFAIEVLYRGISLKLQVKVLSIAYLKTQLSAKPYYQECFK